MEGPSVGMEFKDMKVLLPTKSIPKVRKAIQDTGAELTPSMHLAIQINMLHNNLKPYYHINFDLEIV